jgi:galactokinase
MANRVWRGDAPGRLDFMGGVADYSGSLVLQTPISATTRVTVEERAESELQLTSEQESKVTLSLGWLKRSEYSAQLLVASTT